MRSLLILGWLWVTASVALAQVEVKNDGFVAGNQVAYQAGFCTGEAAASRFVAPEAGRQLLKVRFLFGNTTETKTVRITVWDDTAGTTAPGMELYTNEYQVTGSANAFIESDLTAENIIVPGQFRVGVVLGHNGLPAFARDSDGTIAATKNFILADAACGSGGPFTWYPSQTLGLTGDWVIRAEISAGLGGPPDAGVSDGGVDAPPGAGDPCSGNAQCPLGQHCDLAQMVCTFECRSDPDCGGGMCNSLGECLPATGDGGGCGCRTKQDGGLGLWLVLGLAWIAWRRRR